MTETNGMTVLGEPVVTPAPVTPVVEPAKEDQTDPLEQLVGEGKKYADNTALATAYTNADQHIATLLQEKREVEEKLQRQEAQNQTTADLLAALKEPVPPVVPATPVPTEPNLDDAVEKALTAREAVLKAEELRTKAWEVLAKEFGDKDKAKLAIAQYVGEDKAKLAALDQLAIADVGAMVNLLKPQAQPHTELPTGPSQLMGRTVSPTGLTWSKCEALRKEDVRQYNSIEFQSAMHKAAALNPEFMKT